MITYFTKKERLMRSPSSKDVDSSPIFIPEKMGRE